MLTMTKGDILELTNNAKRKAVLEAWNEWPVWADVPEIGLTVYKLDLPDGKAFTASWYAGDDFYLGGMAGNTNRPRFHLIGGMAGNTNRPRFHLIGAGGKLAHGSQAESVLIEHLQALRKELLAQQNSK